MSEIRYIYVGKLEALYNKKKNNSKRIKHACSETLTAYKCHQEVVGCLMAKALINYLPEDGDPKVELSQDRK